MLSIYTMLLKGGLWVARSGLALIGSANANELAKYQADVGMVTELGGEALRTQARINETWGNVVTQAMTHPIWWILYCLFVIPAGLYDASVFFVSTFDAVLNTPGCVILSHGQPLFEGQHICEWYVTAVPPAQAASRTTIIYSIFGAQAALGAGAGIFAAVRSFLGRRD